MIKIGLVIKGKKEMVWYGCEISAARKDELTGPGKLMAEVEITDTYEDFFSGVAIGDPGRISSEELEIKYYFADEEDPAGLGDDRTVDLDRVRVISRRPGRKKCEPGFYYLCGGEYIVDSIQYKHFETGFLPPFNPEDIILFVEDLTDFGFPGFVLFEMTYQGKTASYSESELIFERSYDTRLLDD